MTELIKFKPCPFCGGEVDISIHDDEGNKRDGEYENNPWSGLIYGINHYFEGNEECPITTYKADNSTLGVWLYDSREEAIRAWNKRI